MSADVWLVIDTGGPDPARVSDTVNVTYNLTPMLRAAGFTGWRDLLGTSAAESSPMLRETLRVLTEDAERLEGPHPAERVGNAGLGRRGVPAAGRGRRGAPARQMGRLPVTASEIPQGCVVYSVRTLAPGAPSGAESCVATLPPGVYIGDAVHVGRLGVVLRDISTTQAAAMGETLHHADWVITTDPGVVETIGMRTHPGCARCRAGVDQALTRLREHPAEQLLVGVLYWAAPDA